MTSIAPTLQGFFTERLISQRHVSSRTIASYRDSLKLLLTFAQQRTGKKPHALDWADLDAELITAFLEHLETQRHNTTRTRNLRLTAIRSLFSYAALRHPEHAALIQQVLAIPAKRFGRQLISFLTEAETDALLAACDLSRWEGRRDRALLLVAAQTGLRVSELTGLNCGDVTLGTGASVRCLGKGRKHRAVPLTTPTQAVLRVWMTERAGLPGQPLFPTRTGRRLSADAVQRLVRQHAVTAALRCPSIRPDKLHPHILRHTCVICTPFSA
jgi:site-specific recombinase XerD